MTKNEWSEASKILGIHILQEALTSEKTEGREEVMLLLICPDFQIFHHLLVILLLSESPKNVGFWFSSDLSSDSESDNKIGCDLISFPFRALNYSFQTVCVCFHPL